MKKNIIFLVCWPITDREKIKWGFDVLQANGLTVKICDVTALCNELALQRNPVANALTDDYIFKFTSYNELEIFLHSTSTNSVYIDYIRGLNDLDTSVEKIFRLLKKNKIKYYTIVNGTLPTANVELNSTDWYHWLINRIIATMHPVKFLHYVTRKSIAFLRRNRVVYPLPTKIFATDAPLVTQRLLKYNLKSNIMVKVHSDDYYDFLKYEFNSNDRADLIDKPYCVFIDEGAVGHPDLDSCGIKRLDAKSYSAEIDKILTYIEDNLAINVIVAAHPRLDLEILKSVYPRKTIVKGETLALTSKAEFVMSHLSTAMGFAALFKKPIIVIETTEMRKNHYYHQAIHTMANALGIQPFQIDVEPLSKIGEYRQCSMRKYDEYISRYIKTVGASDENLWDIVSKEIAKDIG